MAVQTIQHERAPNSGIATTLVRPRRTVNAHLLVQDGLFAQPCKYGCTPRIFAGRLGGVQQSLGRQVQFLKTQNEYVRITGVLSDIRGRI